MAEKDCMNRRGWLLASGVLLGLVLAHLCYGQRAESGSALPQSDVRSHLIARDRASVEAWNRKDKAFFEDFFADDATFFGPANGRLESMKKDFMPKFEEYTQTIKYVDYEMENTQVQLYGDVAILTFNLTANLSFNGQPIRQANRSTVVFAKQGNTWRVVHAHESINPTVKKNEAGADGGNPDRGN